MSQPDCNSDLLIGKYGTQSVSDRCPTGPLRRGNSDFFTSPLLSREHSGIDGCYHTPPRYVSGSFHPDLPRRGKLNFLLLLPITNLCVVVDGVNLFRTDTPQRHSCTLLQSLRVVLSLTSYSRVSYRQ